MVTPSVYRSKINNYNNNTVRTWKLLLPQKKKTQRVSPSTTHTSTTKVPQQPQRQPSSGRGRGSSKLPKKQPKHEATQPQSKQPDLIAQYNTMVTSIWKVIFPKKNNTKKIAQAKTNSKSKLQPSNQAPPPNSSSGKSQPNQQKELQPAAATAVNPYRTKPTQKEILADTNNNNNKKEPSSLLDHCLILGHQDSALKHTIILQRQVSNQTWGADFPGLEVIHQTKPADDVDESGEKNDNDDDGGDTNNKDNDDEFIEVEVEEAEEIPIQQPQPQPPTTRPDRKLRGSIWHASVTSQEAPTMKRPMRSRASLVRLANRLEFDSDAFSSSSDDASSWVPSVHANLFFYRPACMNIYLRPNAFWRNNMTNIPPLPASTIICNLHLVATYLQRKALAAQSNINTASSSSLHPLHTDRHACMNIHLYLQRNEWQNQRPMTNQSEINLLFHPPPS